MPDLSVEKIVEMNELIEAKARVSYLQCAPREFAEPFRLQVKSIGAVWVTKFSAVDHALYNRIMGLGVEHPVTESGIDEAVAFFQDTGCNHYMAQVSPYAQPAQYAQWLAERGFKPGRNMAKVFRGNEPVSVIPTDFRLEMIEANKADAYADVVLRVYDMRSAYRPLVKGHVGKPGWYHCLAFEGEKPVAAVAMFISDDVAWLGFGGTLKTHRRRGAEGAIIARLIQEGFALGCKWFVGETDEDTPEHPNSSFRNTMRNGFKLAYLRRNFYHQPPTKPINEARRALFVGAYSLRFELQHFLHS